MATAVERQGIVASLPLALEAGYSAQSAEDHDQILERLRLMPWAWMDEKVQHRALDAQRQLARVGHHRVSPLDLVLAALADRYELDVLHYDRDYDVIAEKTDLRFTSIWLAEPGTL